MVIADISPQHAWARQRQGAVLIDIRAPHEQADGMAEGALALSAAELKADPGRHLPSRDGEVLLICRSGKRSQVAAQELTAAGYVQVSSVAGGTLAWQAQGLPMVRAMLSDEARDFNERYARHLLLPEVGPEGQRRLQRARVLLVGAGGLGAPASYYLAAAGVGHLRIVDHDRVERSNLQRQIVHTDASIGELKVASAQARLQALNPTVAVEAIAEKVTVANIEALMADVDVVIDGSDNFPVRYLLNDACIKHARPLVHAAVERFQGQVTVFDAGRQRGVAPCYRCLFPEPPPAQFAPSCAEAGVLGVLPGLAGLLQATEVLKLLLDIGMPLTGRLLRFDALGMQMRESRVRPDPDCTVCAPGAAFPGYIDYPAFCSGRPSG